MPPILHRPRRYPSCIPFLALTLGHLLRVLLGAISIDVCLIATCNRFILSSNAKRSVYKSDDLALNIAGQVAPDGVYPSQSVINGGSHRILQHHGKCIAITYLQSNWFRRLSRVPPSAVFSLDAM